MDCTGNLSILSQRLFTNFFLLMCSGEKPTGCWTNLWSVPAKRRVVGKERERAGSMRGRGNGGSV